LRPSIRATNSQAGCPSGQFTTSGAYVNTNHMKCSSGYSVDLDDVTGTGTTRANEGLRFCYLNSYLQWLNTYRSRFTCPANPTVVCNGTNYTANVARKAHGMCLAYSTSTSCTTATLTCTGTYNRYPYDNQTNGTGFCFSL